MKMIYTIIPSVILALSGCSNIDPVLAQKDWDGTAEYYASSDAPGFHTYYKPRAGFVGDPMPFYDPVAKDFKILYLQDFRPNPAATYHPIWGVSTVDGGAYTSLGELVGCGSTEEQDAAIGTGCTVYNESDKLYYTFYTGNKYQPTAEESGQVVMLATSPDFRTWTKNRQVYIKGEDNGCSKNDFRDPFVFADDNGLWHMVVATRKSGKGWLVEYTSNNLVDWTFAGDFMMMVWDRFYECPDIFKMGDWWYLVYSEMHSAIRKVQYFKGRTLDELKAATAGDSPKWPDGHEGFLDSRGFYAGKTASDGTDRYMWGWCPTRKGKDNTETGAAPNEPEWAGNLVVHRLVQHDDGSLSLGMVPGIDRKYTKNKEVKVMAQSDGGVTVTENGFSLNGDSYVLFNRLGVANKISFTVRTSTPSDKFGVSVVRGTDSGKYYTMVINPEGVNRKINFEEEGEDGKGFVDGIDSYLFPVPDDNTYDISIYTDNSVLVMYINDNVAYTNRIYGMNLNCWSINNYGGTVEVSDISVRQQ